MRLVFDPRVVGLKRFITSFITQLEGQTRVAYKFIIPLFSTLSDTKFS